MRVRSRISDERGATAVMFVILLVVFIAILALATDGGLLFVKYRQVRRANDSAALAAAINCVKFPSQGIAGANAAADSYARQNVTDAATWADNEYQPNPCVATAGKVTVHYGALQSLSFGPAIGISSPKQVTASATARWGAAGSVGKLIPLTVAEGTDLGKCTASATYQPAIGDPCTLFWSQSDPVNGKWGVIDLRLDQNGVPLYWNVSSDPTNSDCGGNLDANTLSQMMSGVSGNFSLTPTPPNPYVYVCAGVGNFGGSLTQAINTSAACPDGPQNTQTCKQDIVNMPIFRPSASVYVNGQLVKFAVVGFAALRIMHVYGQSENPYAACHLDQPTGGGSTDARCLVATWQGFSTGGLSFSDGTNYGATNVALTG
jgi:Flp pilus assembly protein TadG